MKRAHLPFTLVLFLGVIILGGNATAFTCGIGTTIPAGLGYIPVLCLSNTTNAHVELPIAGACPNYPQIVYCGNEPGVTFSTNTGAEGLNTLYHISSPLATPTNAHIEVPGTSPNLYPTRLNLTANTGTVTATFVNGIGIACPAGYISIARISTTSNAHAESPTAIPQNYPLTLCVGYNASAGGFTDKDILTLNQFPSTTLADPIPYIEEGTSSSVATTLNNLVEGYADKANYSVIKSTWVAAICDLDNTPQCANIDTVSEYQDELALLFAAQPNALITPTVTAVDYKLLGGGNFLDGVAVSNNLYTIDTDNTTAMGPSLEPGTHYRILLLAVPSVYDYSGAKNELSAFYPNNFQLLDFEVTPDGTGPPGPGPAGSGGDVFILKNIDYAPNPPIEGKQFDALITIQNKRTDLTTNGTLNVIIRDGDGKEIPGFNPATTPVSFPLPASGTNAEITQPVTIEFDSDSIGAFAPGQTYTLYATITPFEDTTIPIDEDDETVKGNNSTFKTFTVLEPQTTLNVPDAPPWMSVFMALIVLGWLFVSSRKEDQE